ncbi:unnamed protein product [Colias eurytheme]|nr:unnamed protein product [Colias eurytheme]
MFNRNFNITNNIHLNTNRNVIHPSISLHPVEEREINANAEITEILNSSDEIEERKDSENYSFAHAWSYISQDLFTNEDSYRINEAARERRRNKNNQDEEYSNRPTMNETYDRSPNHLYPSFYSLDRNYSNDQEYKSYHNRQVNRFTIPNNLGTSSTSSDDPNADIELIQCGDAISNRDYWNDTLEPYNEEIYFAQEHDKDKRTIWIYSYKNKRILSDNDYMLTNISSSCTSSTDELEFEPTKEANINRIATPIPYIPRLNLNLTSTLPTVTEVTEPLKQSSMNDADVNNAAPINSIQKTPDTWSSHEKRQPSTNRSKSNANHSQDNRSISSPRAKRFHPMTKYDRNNNKFQTNENLVYCEPNINIITNNKGNDSGRYDDEPDLQVVERGTSVDHLENETINLESSNQLLTEKPRIQITSKPVRDQEISDPIEKLEGNWIGDNRTNDEPSILYDCDINNENNIEQKELDVTHVIPTSDNQFFIRNLPLLKPAEWNEYLPITGSVPSLELTIDTDLESTKKSWFKKLFTCVKCLKINKNL